MANHCGNGIITLCMFLTKKSLLAAVELQAGWFVLQFLVLLLVDFQHGQEGFLRDFDFADALHALFAFFLFFQQFAFA